jgi:hypothetical protein
MVKSTLSSRFFVRHAAYITITGQNDIDMLALLGSKGVEITCKNSWIITVGISCL